MNKTTNPPTEPTVRYGDKCPECGLSWAHGSVKCDYPYPDKPIEKESEPTVEKCHTCHKPLITDWHEGDCIKCARDKVDKKAHCKKHNLNHGLKYKSCRI